MGCHCALRFYVGDPLPSLLDSLLHYTELLQAYGQPTMRLFLDPLIQACLYLTGRGGADLLVSNEKEPIRQQTESWQDHMYLWVLLSKLHIAVYMNELEFAGRDLAAELRNSKLELVLPYACKFKYFYDGIIAAIMSQRSRICRWRARKRLKYLQKSALRCPENTANKVFFLEAELAASAGQYDRASLEYEKAIEYARKEHYLSEEALACERLARMCLSLGNTSEATKYFSTAIKLYQRWGAKVKTDQLRELCKREKLHLEIDF